MDLIRRMSLNHPLFFDTQCRLYMPSTILGKYNPFATAYIEYTCRGTITKEEIKIDQALKEWEKVRFFYNCILTCSHKTLKQNEYDYLCSQDFKELCNCFKYANPPIYGDGGVLIFESFTSQNTYINIPHQQGEYLIKGIQYFPTLDCVDFDLIQKYSNKESYTEVPCTKDFPTYLNYIVEYIMQ